MSIISVIEMDKKPTLVYTPLFIYWTLFIGYAFLYSFTLTAANPQLAASFGVFQGLYVLGWIWILFTFKFEEDRSLDRSELMRIIFWVLIGVTFLAMLNIMTSVVASMAGLAGLGTVWINSAVYTDFWLAMLAGYCEEIAFIALAAMITRLAWSKRMAIVTVGLLFPLFHIISYPNILTPNVSAIAIFFLLFMGRILLSSLYLITERIEVPIFVHAIWDGLSVLVAIATAIIGV